jgi:predicted DNA-binding transcriptional regulator AlpA
VAIAKAIRPPEHRALVKAGGKQPFGGLKAPPRLGTRGGRCNSGQNWRGIPPGKIALTANFMQGIRSYFKYDSCIFYATHPLPGAKTRTPSLPRAMKWFTPMASPTPQRRTRRPLPPAPVVAPDALLTPREAAAYRRQALSSFWLCVKRGDVPPPLRLGAKSPRWRARDLAPTA